MITFAVVGPAGSGKTALINSLINKRQVVQSDGHLFESDDKITCQIIDTPPDCDPTNLPTCDIILYTADIQRGVDSAKWAEFYARNKMRSVQIVLVLTKCDSAPAKTGAPAKRHVTRPNIGIFLQFI